MKCDACFLIDLELAIATVPPILLYWYIRRGIFVITRCNVYQSIATNVQTLVNVYVNSNTIVQTRGNLSVNSDTIVQLLAHVYIHVATKV